MAYAVFSSDSVIDWGVSGRRKVGTTDSIKLKDRWNIGTNTAAFTAFVAASMVEKGQLKWTTKVIDIFPELKKKLSASRQGITLFTLLSHQSGLPLFSQMEDWSNMPALAGDSVARRRAFVSYILVPKSPSDTISAKKRKGFSVAGYIVAAAMMERVSGKSWEKLVEEYISKPLGISIKYGWPNRIDSASPWGHGEVGGPFHPEGPETWVRMDPFFNPANNITLSLHDYIRFLQENLRGLLGKHAHLSAQTFRLIHYGVLDNALGWNNGSLDNYSFSFHEGISLLFDCRAELIKEKNIGVLVLANSGNNDARGGVLNMTRILEQYALTR